MFKDITFDIIMKRMLSRISADVDKREGSIIYDALAPAAVELQLAYLEMQAFLNEVFADTASREYLIRRASERGLTPEEATCAILKAEFTPTDIDVLNQRFNCGELNYTVIELISDGVFKVQCETEGVIGNTNFGTLVPIEYIAGLQSAKLTELIIPGEDEEDTEVFRQRYMNSLQSKAFGGNVADYKEKVLALDGVGGVKVYRAEDWNGAGTVRLVIQSSNYGIPTATFISELQDIIDPDEGGGTGLAPIGHQVTVESVTPVGVGVVAHLTFDEGVEYTDISEAINTKLKEYYAELNENWQNVDNIVVSLTQVVIRLLEVEGVADVDISSVTINDKNENSKLGRDVIIDIEAEDTAFKLSEE